MMNFYTVGVLFLSVLSVVTGALISKSCVHSSECPANSSCKLFDNRYQCLCDVSYQPPDDGSRCLKVVELDGDCTQSDTICRRGPWGRAVNVDGKCRCEVSYRRSGKTRCVMDAVTSVGYALLGDPCGPTQVCLFSRTQYCHEYPDGARCTCKSHFMETGEDMHSAVPLIDECLSENLATLFGGQA